MKISRGALIGLIVSVLWMAAVMWGMQNCNWNWVCNGAIKPGLCSADWVGRILILPTLAIEAVLFFILKPFGTVSELIILIFGILIVLILGVLLGALVEKLINVFKRK